MEDAAVDLIFKLQAVWSGINGRCNSPSHVSYKDYGARGIKLCKEWTSRKGCIRFVKWALKNGYQPKLDVGRKRNNGPYSPGNCVFITRKENCWDRRSSLMLTYKGETKCSAAWSDDPRCVVHRYQFQQRIACGWKIERALSTPLRRGHRAQNQKSRTRRS